MKKANKKITLELVEREKNDKLMLYYIELNKEFQLELQEAQDSIDILYRKKQKFEKNFFSNLLLNLFQKHESDNVRKEHA